MLDDLAGKRTGEGDAWPASMAWARLTTCSRGTWARPGDLTQAQPGEPPCLLPAHPAIDLFKYVRVDDAQ